MSPHVVKGLSLRLIYCSSVESNLLYLLTTPNISFIQKVNIIGSFGINAKEPL